MAADMTSVLSCTKKLMGIEDEYKHFDPDIITGINSALTILYQLGVTKTAKIIYSDEEKWTDIIGEREDLELIKNYVVLRVKLLFDPPTSGFLLESIKQQIAEFEWRLNVAVDPDTTFTEE